MAIVGVCAFVFCGCDSTKSKIATSINNLKQIGCALERDDVLPNGVLKDSSDTTKDPAAVFNFLKNEGLVSADMLISPFDSKSTPADSTVTAANVSYVYIYCPTGNAYSSELPMVFEKPWLLPEGLDLINVCYADGHTRTEGIQGVSEMSCRQVLEILLKDVKDLSEDQKKVMFSYADLADQSR